MQFLYFLERIRVPVLNECMLLITQLGEAPVFLILALIVFWCVDKYKGYYILSVGFIGTIINQFLKLWFRIPRPWVKDANFTILEGAREAATGYSFPSGHTQSAVGVFGALAYSAKNRWIRWIAVTIAVLVPFSRMYVGVHTPLDVFVSIAIAILLIVLIKPLVLSKNHNILLYLIGFMVLMACAFMDFVHLYQFPVDVDLVNKQSGFENAYMLFGAMFGLLIVYVIDENWLKFPTKAPLWAQIIKVVFGLMQVLLVKSYFGSPLNSLLGENWGCAAQYCLLVIVAGILWPLSFRFFCRLGNKNKKVNENA